MLLGTYRRRHQTAPSNYNPIQLDVGTHMYQTNASLSDTVVDLIQVATDVRASKDPVGPPPCVSPTPEPSNTPSPVTPPATDPLSEFDEYGTELHADARVWKVYVKETDRHDADLVKEWNDSTDVILIFAALFSAVSAAFIIESSKMLKTDPADVSAQALLVISQTLASLANGTQLPGSAAQTTSRPVEFVPTRTAIYVNALWYLSLGLSLATSFIAILSKDWCRSFMSSRTGQPYLQARRRQQKWEMIEKWKMSELLAILPSLIHVALLLFSIGLCLYLWDMQATVAIPVLCVTGAAIGFYIWSSLSAMKLNYSPYPTIISKLYRSDAVQRILCRASTLVSRTASHPLIRNLYQSTWILQLVTLWAINWFLSPARLLFRSVLHLDGFWLPVRWSVHQLVRLAQHLEWVAENNRDRLRKADWGLDWDQPAVQTVPQGSNHKPEQDAVTSRALSWLIVNCEAPESVDIALQAIAGGSTRISKQPLHDCGATLEIVKRLAFSNIYRGSLAKRDEIVSLYRRALAFLGSSADSDEEPTGSQLEGLICDLHAEAEKYAAFQLYTRKLTQVFRRKVAALIVDSNFKPTEGNLDALQIGNTIALKTLKMLKPGPCRMLAEVDSAFKAMVRLLEAHLSGIDPLHEAALISLLNAASLISPFAHGIPSASQLPMLCIQLVGPQNDFSICNASLVTSLATSCILSLDKFADRNGLGELENRSRLAMFVRGMTEGYSLDERTLWMRSMVGLEMALLRPEPYHLVSMARATRETHLEDVALCISAVWDGFYAFAREERGPGTQGQDLYKFLRALQATYNLVPDETPQTSISFFTLVPMELLWSHPYFCQMTPGDVWVRFPTHSRTLVQLLEKCEFIPRLEQLIDGGEEHQVFIAMGQLWLLFTLYLSPSELSADDQDRLRTQIQRYRPQCPECEIVRHWQLGDQLEEMWNNFSRFQFFEPRLEWIARLMECVFQSRNSPLPEDLYQEVCKFPREIRGLSSFTTWRPPIEAEEINIQQSVCSLSGQTYSEQANSANDTAPKVGIRALGDETGNMDVRGYPTVYDDCEETQQLGITGLGNHGLSGRAGQQESGGENTRSREGHRDSTGSTESQVGRGGVGPGRATQGSDEAHLLIDMYPLGTASN